MQDLFSQPDAPAYFNTTSERGDTLRHHRGAAERQVDRVVEIFRARGALSPSQLMPHFGPSVPLTSIRRAITVATTRGLLVKTTDRRVGSYGRKEHIWRPATT